MPDTSYPNPSESDGPRGYGGSGEETVQTQTASPQGAVDMDAVRAARREIEGLVQEIAEMSRSDVAADVFYDALLNKVVQALAALGGAVWILGETGGLQLQYQINVRDTGLQNDPVAQMQHGRLLTHVMESGGGTLIAPHSGAGEASAGDENAAANPTDFLLILSPVHNDQGPQGVVEVFQRPGARVATQRGYLNFLDQMCGLAGDYLKAQRLRLFTDKQTLWEQLEAFTRTAHQTLDLRQTAYSIANDGRRLIGCDRVSVAIQRGGKCKIESISGQDTFDKRSNVIAMLGRLASAVTATGEDLWYTGDTTDLAPQVEDALDAYIDESHSKAVAVLPLFTPRLEEETAPDEDEPEPPKVVGALIVEQMVDSRPPEGLAQRVDIVRQHSASAITNSQEHESLFLMPLWKTIGKTRWLVRARTLPKTIVVSAVILLLLLWLCFWPADFALQARGNLQPTIRQNVFAGVDGQVDGVLVGHNDGVEAGEPLVRLKNSKLEQELTAIQGQIATNETELNNVLHVLRDRAAPRRETPLELSGRAAELRVTLESLVSQEKWLREQRKLLEVTSPIKGVVTSWKVRERLQGVPVNRGNLLMEIADPAGPWELELVMPENRMGHITQAAKESDGPLAVTFILATSPEDEHQGQVAQIEGTAEVRGEDGNTVLIRVDFEQALLKEFAGLRPGAEVTAKVHCGTAPIGYVWLHDLIGWVRSKVLFRF